MIALFVSSGARVVARMCGADQDDADAIRIGVAGLFAVVDPVGAFLACGQTVSGNLAREGNSIAQVAKVGFRALSMADVVANVIDGAITAVGEQAAETGQTTSG